jgi:hypothetical protein
MRILEKICTIYQFLFRDTKPNPQHYGLAENISTLALIARGKDFSINILLGLKNKNNNKTLQQTFTCVCKP